MKTLFIALICLVLFSNATANANAEPVQTVRIVRSNLVYPLTAQLNPQTVRCLVGDYGASSLKISLENLKGLTVFRHTTRGEVQPCINAGACKTRFSSGGLTPEMILDPKRPTEPIQVHVVLNEVLTIDSVNHTCGRALEEVVTSPVRGLNFAHLEGAELGALDYNLCIEMASKAPSK